MTSVTAVSPFFSSNVRVHLYQTDWSSVIVGCVVISERVKIEEVKVAEQKGMSFRSYFNSIHRAARAFQDLTVGGRTS